MERQCNSCGERSDWNKVFDKDYPERRRDRDRTVQNVYVCRNCGAEGKHFEHSGEPDTFSAAMR